MSSGPTTLPFAIAVLYHQLSGIYRGHRLRETIGRQDENALVPTSKFLGMI